MSITLPALSGRQLAGVCLILMLGKLWLVSPYELVAVNMPHDDLLFITLAENLLRGEWLGQYDQMTLIKGPFYPLFIAASYLVGIPLLAAQQLLYGAACWVCVCAVMPDIRNRWLLLIMFLFLLLNPFSYNYPAVGRVLRLNIYQSLGLLVFGAQLGLYIRSKGSFKSATGWSILAGLALSAFWHTREESVWIVPSLLLLLLALVLRYRKADGPGKLQLIAVFSLPLVIWAGATLSLRWLNYTHYGIFATIELETDAFKSAYGGLLRIKSDKWRRQHPAVKDARDQAYRVSPTFRQVEPFLEGDLGKAWAGGTRGSGDIMAAFFIWAFRDAVAYAGYYRDGPRTMEFYRNMGQELDAACEQNKVKCRPRLSSLMPPWHREFNPFLVRTFRDVFKRIILFNEFSTDYRKIVSRASPELQRRYAVVTHEQVRPNKADEAAGNPSYDDRLDREKIRILADIGSLYKKIVPVSFTVACCIVALFFLLPGLRRKMSCYIMFALSLIVGISAISFILTLVVITSYNSIQRAMQVSYPLVLLTIVCSLFGALDYLSKRGRQEYDP